VKITKSQLKQIIKEELQAVMETAVQLSAKHDLSMQIAELVDELKDRSARLGAPLTDEDVIEMIKGFREFDREDVLMAVEAAEKMLNPEESGRLDEVMDAESLKVLAAVLQKMLQPGELESMLAVAGAAGAGAAYHIRKLRKKDKK
jgi:hypothetical protein